MAPFRGFVTREPGQGGIRDPPEQESGNREAEQNMFMPLTAESAERLLAVVPLTKVRSWVHDIADCSSTLLTRI